MAEEEESKEEPEGYFSPILPPELLTMEDVGGGKGGIALSRIEGL